MARLPISGSDDNVWGNILNDYLSVEHNADGTQKTLDITKGGTGQTSASAAVNALMPSQTGQNGKFLGTDGSSVSWTATSGSGDASTNTSSSIDSEIAIFSGTGGKTLKRATGTGIATLSSGVLGAITAPSGALVGTTDTQALTNKRVTSRVTSITSSATPTINTDNCDAVTITALATAITSFTSSLSGTPNDFDKLIIRIKDDGTARAITWGSSFEAKGVSLPTTTVLSKVLTVGFIYDSVTAKWGCVASAQEA